jgi:hypothetical protein
MRVLGWLAMALGVIGFIASLLLATGVWVVKPNFQARVDGLFAQADSGLQRAATLTDNVQARLAEVTGRVDDIKTRTDAFAAAPVLDGTVATAIATTITDFVSGPYANLRSEYAALKERVTNVGESLQALDNAVPAITLPGTARERLQEIDAQFVQIDAQVTAIGEATAEGLPVPGVAARISGLVAQAQTFLTGIVDRVNEVEARLQQTRDRLTSANESIRTGLTLSAAAVTILGLYLAGLHILLFQQGRRWTRRGHTTPPA